MSSCDVVLYCSPKLIELLNSTMILILLLFAFIFMRTTLHDFFRKQKLSRFVTFSFYGHTHTYWRIKQTINMHTYEVIVTSYSYGSRSLSRRITCNVFYLGFASMAPKTLLRPAFDFKGIRHL